MNFIRKNYIGLFIIGMLITSIAICFVFRIILNGASLDMTDEKQYSLSAYSKQQVKDISLPLFITIYYSQEISQENPQYGKYANFVMRFFQEYQKQNPDKIFINVKNVTLYSEAEKEAKNNKLSPVLISKTQNPLYFGAVFQNSEGETHKISDFSPNRYFWLELDISTMINRFNNHERKIVGLISPIHKMIKKGFGQKTENYAFIDELFSRYDIMELAYNTEEIPHDIDTLLVVSPQKVPNSLKYALDQYVLRGGKLIMLLDNIVEDPYYKTTIETTNNLNDLLHHWGLSINNSLLASQKYGKNLFIGETNQYRYSQYPLWIDVKSTEINQKIPFMKKLKSMSFRTPLDIKAINISDQITLTPLISIAEGGIYQKEEYVFDKNTIIKNYKSDNLSHSLAYMSEGKYQSQFTQKPQILSSSQYPHLIYSTKPGTVIVIGDSDFIRDDVWLDEGRLNDNGQFLLKTIEYLNNNHEIINLYSSQNINQNEALGQKIYNQIYNRYSFTIMSLQNELQSLQQELDRHLSNIRTGEQLINAQLSKRVNEIRNRIADIERNLQYNIYKIKQLFEDKTQSIIFVNMIVMPFFIIIIWLLSYRFFVRRGQKKIQERYNVNK